VVLVEEHLGWALAVVTSPPCVVHVTRAFSLLERLVAHVSDVPEIKVGWVGEMHGILFSLKKEEEEELKGLRL